MKKRTESDRGSRHRKGGRAFRGSKKRQSYTLCLYITGYTPRAKAAILKVKSFCEECLKDRYQLDVIDIYQQPSHAREEQIIAAPTLIKKLPPPLRRLVGDFSSRDRVLLGLDL
jgi:circadian clock protein KaiB